MEREIVTLALGNYSTLVAAQFVNGTSRFDVEHDVLFMERRGAGSKEDTRAPRLLLLDHSHATELREEDHLTLDEAAQHPTLSAANDDAMKQQYHYDPERFAEEEEEEEEEEEDEYAQRQEEEERSGAAASHHHHRRQQQQKEEKEAAPLPKSGIFKQKDRVVPWWKYIRVPLMDTHSYHLLRDPHGDPSGGAPLGAFGFGHRSLSVEKDPVMASYCDSLRFMLEASDACQGLQLFLDANSALAGAGVNVLSYAADEFGSKLPTVVVSNFASTLDEGVRAAHGTHDKEEEAMLRSQRLQKQRDTLVLNRGLGLHFLSTAASLFVPMEVSSWDAIIPPKASWRVPSGDNIATAQAVATTMDSALLGLRTGGGKDQTDPIFSLRELTSVLRLSPVLRVTSAFAAVPLRVHQAEGTPTFADVLQRNPLYPINPTSSLSAAAAAVASSGSAVASPSSSFVPLTHRVVYEPDSDRGRVVGHNFTLRGIGSLQDTRVTRDEAVLRYAAPLQTSTFRSVVVNEGYPVSDTFPASVLFPEPYPADFPGSLRTVDVGAQLACTLSAAPMLADAVHSFSEVVKYRKHLHRDMFAMEDDEWRDVLEDMHALRDAYDRQDVTGDEQHDSGSD